MSFVVLMAALMAALLGGVWVGPASANPLDAFGFGSRAIAMGGAYTGLADDVSANYYNPAGLAQGEDIRLDLGYIYVDPILRFNGSDANVDVVKGLQGGVVLPGEVLDTRFGAGIGLMLLDDRITRVRSLPQQQPRFVLFDNRTQRLYITANFAIEPVENLFIGGGLTFMANTMGRLEIDGVVSMVDSERTALQSAVDVDIASSRYPEFGILYTPDAPWSLGLVFRDEYYLKLGLGTLVTGQIVLDNDPENPIVLVEEGRFFVDSPNANLYSPRQIVLGGAYTADWLTISMDIGLYLWSNFPAPTSDVTIDLDLADINFSVPDPDPVQAPNFTDLIIPRVGFEADLIDGNHLGLVARAGYYFEDTPAPDQPGLTNYADAAKHGFSMGLGLSLSDVSEVFPKPLLLDLSLLYIRMVEREYLKTDPADLIGDYSIDGDFFGVGVLMGVLL